MMYCVSSFKVNQVWNELNSGVIIHSRIIKNLKELIVCLRVILLFEKIIVMHQWIVFSELIAEKDVV